MQRAPVLGPDGLASEPGQNSKLAKVAEGPTPALSGSVTSANYTTSLSFSFFICNLGVIAASSLSGVILSVN